MKTRIHIIAAILALMMAPALMNAQTARRSEARGSTQSSTAKKSTQVQRSQPQKQKATRQSTVKQQSTRQRTSQPQQSTRQRTSQPAREVQRSQPQANNQKQQVMRQSTVKQQAARVDKPVSISTDKNPKSKYRSPDSHRYAKPNKYSDKRYYSGRHYHNVHPTRRIRVHYHHDTYLHNYHVLYYPSYHEIYWTRNMYRDYHRWYPNYRWRYNYGYRIQTISVFDAKYNLGEVKMVYGRVYAAWHNQETDDYLLFFGGDYPYQQFTVILPGNVARRFSWRPERFFPGEHMTSTGLITTSDGIPEIIVKNKRQVGIY